MNILIIMKSVMYDRGSFNFNEELKSKICI